MERPEWILLIGDEDVTSEARDVKFTTRLSAKADLNFSLPLDVIEHLVLDLTAPVTLSDAQDPSSRPRGKLMFAGNVDAAEAVGDTIRVKCHSLADRLEHVGVRLLKNELVGPDTFFLLGFLGGFQMQQMVMETGAPDAGEFDIIVPLSGIAVDSGFRVGSVHFQHPNSVASMEDLLQPELPLQRLEQLSQSVARVRLRDARAISAEQRGIRLIHDALAWITVQAADGRFGRGQRHFSMSNLRIQPRNIGIVIVQSLDGRGRYFRSLATETAVPVLDAQSDSFAIQDYPDVRLPANLSDALDAFRRAQAASGSNAILAMWESMEFLVANCSPEAIFKPTHKRAIRRELRKAFPSFEERQQSRLSDVLQMLDQAPLLTKVRQFASDHSVRLTELEYRLLATLRKHRNHLLHGRRPEHVEPEDLRHGISVLARLLAAAIEEQHTSPTG